LAVAAVVVTCRFIGPILTKVADWPTAGRCVKKLPWIVIDPETSLGKFKLYLIPLLPSRPNGGTITGLPIRSKVTFAMELSYQDTQYGTAGTLLSYSVFILVNCLLKGLTKLFHSILH
jgi:hypothetical protein